MMYCQMCREGPQERSMVTCSDCGTLHHEDCFTKRRSCAADSCGGSSSEAAEPRAYVVAPDARDCPLYDRLGAPVSLTAPRAAVGPGGGLTRVFLKMAVAGYLTATAGWIAWMLGVWSPLTQDMALHLGFVFGAIGTILRHRSATTLVLDNDAGQVVVRHRLFSLTGWTPVVSYAALGRVCYEASEDSQGGFRRARVWLETRMGQRIPLEGPSREDETQVRRNVRHLAEHLGLEVKDLGRRCG